MRTILQDKLLQVQESTLVGHLLSDLNCGSEGVVGETLLAVRALLVGHNVLDLKGLLDNSALECLLLDSDLHLDTARVGFGPNETGVDDTDFVQTSKSAQTNGKKFFRFGRSDDPAVGGL